MSRLQYAAIPLTILALVGLTACDGSSDPMSTLAPANNLEFAEMQLLDFEDAVTAAGDATLEGMMAFPPDLSPGRRYVHSTWSRNSKKRSWSRTRPTVNACAYRWRRFGRRIRRSSNSFATRRSNGRRRWPVFAN